MPETELIEAAKTAAAFAYCPYSRFPVGAAVRANGKIFPGCNIENASLGLTICAERVAIFAAVAAGCKCLSEVAISCPSASAGGELTYRMPCGACRQVMAQFGDENTRVFVQGIGVFLLGELLKHPFRL